MGSEALDFSKLTDAEFSEYVRLRERLDTLDAQRQIDHWFPDETHDWRGDTYYARHLYPRHLEFFAAGADYSQRMLRAANRVGKTVAGGCELAYHLTGRYPDWWIGRRFDRPISAWVAGRTTETTRDILQVKLFGKIRGDDGAKSVDGTGIIPGDAIGRVTWRRGVADLADTVQVKHKSGAWSTVGLKSYEQGSVSFEGTEKHVIWLDEEPPMSVYTECLTRTMVVDGVVVLTFTPLAGMSDVVKLYMKDAE